MEYMVELRNVRLQTQSYEILKCVTVSFPEGQSSLILGTSGSGKSTLLKVAAGIIPPDEGEVCIQGENLQLISEASLVRLRSECGFVFQDAALWANKTVYENLALPLQLHFQLSLREMKAIIEQSLERVHLLDSIHLRPAQLSTGERKIVSFLRALIVKPRIVFLDEPTVSIDQSAIEEMLKIITMLKQKACTIIMVTHDPNLASMLADYLVIIDDGMILTEGNFDSVRRSEDIHIQNIISSVLDQAPTYDTDLLELLSDDVIQ